jgi:uncharacterized membrane protein YsdA (DUF1294 family)
MSSTHKPVAPVDQQGHGGCLRPVHLGFLAVLMIVPAMAIWRHTKPEIALGIGCWWAVASIITYALYARDKRSARQQGERTPENVLHFGELIGGWPGAYLAQRHLRHKSSKISYQIVYWLIVATHIYLALDWQLDWRFFSQGKQFIESITH